MKSNRLVFVLSLAMLVIPFSNAQADLIFRDKDGNVVDSISVGCGGRGFTGLELKYTVTDPAGDMFTMQCENRTEFVGKIFVNATKRTTDFGRCIFDQGANVIKFETDSKNNFTEIDWANIDPKGTTPAERAASRNKIIADLATGPGETTKDWAKRLGAYYAANGFVPGTNEKFYEFHFSPNNQDLGFLQDDGSFVIDVTLTPDQADLDYEPDGNSPIADLQIDPAMRTPGNDIQLAESSNVIVPEPGTLFLLGMGMFGVFVYYRHQLSLRRGA